MHKKVILPLFSLLFFLSSSCDEERDKVKEFSKDGSIETVINVEHMNDQLDVIKTTHKIWVKNILVKTSIHTDTVPSLGILKESAEISAGVSKEVAVKKDYEFYITVK